MNPDDQDQLTAAEAAWVRKQMCKQARMRWLWKAARTWASWIGAGCMGLIALADALKRLFDK